jgi:hypothetical protein
MRTAILFVVFAIFLSGAQAHDGYQNWKNRENVGCCNDHDCGPIDDQDTSTKGGKLEVRVEGTWCPVEAKHYLSQGNAPDWSAAHVCVRRYFDEGGIEITRQESVCERLLCYQPKAQF